MRAKLTIRNAKRSAKDYLIYLVTMTVISTLMFAFNGLMFSKDMRRICSEMEMFYVFIGMASFFIIIIVIWLVHYMVHFMLQRRSREFGTYLLLGMKKQQIAGMFRNENILLGLVSFLAGILPGMLFQLAFVNIFYSMVHTTYRLSPDFSGWTYLMTFGLYFFSYFLALLRVKAKFKKMTISDLIYMDRQNEKERSLRSTWKRIFVFASVAYIVFFNILAIAGKMTIISVWFYILGLVAAIYLLYIGLSSVLNSYIKRRRRGIYKGANVFVLRQMSSKMRTMRFTMGTMTILFTTALLSFMCFTMFMDYQNNELPKKYPFDAAVLKEESAPDYTKELAAMEADAGVKESLAYQIYKDGSDTINDYLYAHVDGVSRKVEEDNVASYFQHDTYMGITTYNHLRRMAGYSAVTLSTDHYLFQCNRRVKPLLLRLAKRGKIGCGGESLAYQQTLTDEFMQSELNGADYLVVVPDRTLAHMTPYYSVLAAKLKGKGSAALEDKLGRMQSYNNTEEDEYDFSMVVGYGSDQVFGNSGAVFVKDATVSDFTFAMGALMFFLAYVGIVFLVAALTILAVQQLADSGKYKFRYDILRKLGVGHRGMHRVVGRQLGLYYLCPFAISVLLTFAIGMFASERFVYYTDIQAGIFGYYAAALALFAFLYLIYVCVTYVSFVRNVEHPRV